MQEKLKSNTWSKTKSKQYVMFNWSEIVRFLVTVLSNLKSIYNESPIYKQHWLISLITFIKKIQLLDSDIGSVLSMQRQTAQCDRGKLQIPGCVPFIQYLDYWLADKLVWHWCVNYFSYRVIVKKFKSIFTES